MTVTCFPLFRYFMYARLFSLYAVQSRITQLRLDGNKRIVRRFRRSDPISLLFDIAAHALAEADHKPIAAPFDIIDPNGRALLKAGRVVVALGRGVSETETTGEMTGGSAKDTTIGSERLGGASLLVRRTR